MSPKGEPMTEEHKEKMAEGRRRAIAERKAESAEYDEEQKRLRAESAENKRNDELRAQAQADFEEETEKRETKTVLEREAASAPVEPVPLGDAPTATAKHYGGQDEWGPYDTFEEVHTPYGLYGVNAGDIMWFVEARVWSKKTQEWIDTHQPRYRPAERITA